MYFGMFDPTFIILIPAMIFAFFAQTKVQSAYKRYAGIRNRNGITGAQAARRILDSNGLVDVPIEITQGKLSDHYDPRKKVMRLSQNVYNDPSIASVSIAAHESGHAIQDEKGYAALKIRNSIAPVISVASNLSWPLLIIGIVITIAAHESGHAIQDEKGYAALKIRNSIAPVISVASNLSWPLLIIGIVITSA